MLKSTMLNLDTVITDTTLRSIDHKLKKAVTFDITGVIMLQDGFVFSP